MSMRLVNKREVRRIIMRRVLEQGLKITQIAPELMEDIELQVLRAIDAALANYTTSRWVRRNARKPGRLLKAGSRYGYIRNY